MVEFIILVWMTANPGTNFYKELVGEKLFQVFTTTSTQEFTKKWDSLDGDARKSAKIYRGQEGFVLNRIEILPLPPTPPPRLNCVNGYHDWVCYHRYKEDSCTSLDNAKRETRYHCFYQKCATCNVWNFGLPDGNFREWKKEGD